MPLYTATTEEESPVSASLVFGKTAYLADETITFQVVVDPATFTKDVTFTGAVTEPGQATATTVTGTVPVTDNAEYGQFSAPGYTVAQDPDDPSRYTATPTVG